MASTPQLTSTNTLSPIENALMLSIQLEADDALPLLPLSPRIGTIPLPHLVHTSTHVMAVPSAAAFTPVIAVVETDIVVATGSPSKAVEEVPTSPQTETFPDSPKISAALLVFRLLFVPNVGLLLASTAATSSVTLSCTCDYAPLLVSHLFAASLLFGFIVNEWHSIKSLSNGPAPVELAGPSDHHREVSGAFRALFVGASVVTFLMGVVMLASQAR